jgi:hypothetical protein
LFLLIFRLSECINGVNSLYGLCFQGYGVVLVNTDEAGTLIVTNFRLIFLVSNELIFFACQHCLLDIAMLLAFMFIAFLSEFLVLFHLFTMLCVITMLEE